MNPLEQYPHLFANGKFNIQISKGRYKGKQVKIEAYEPEPQRFLWASFDYNQWGTASVDDCTLIARPIDSLTDEEMEASPLAKALDGYDKKMFLEVCAKNNPNRMNSEQMLYLLSIGVYPFDQSHFDDGTVLNAEEASHA